MNSTIDAHHHLWDLDVTPQPWLSESMLRINRSFLLPDLTVAVGRRIDRTVIVQTVSDEAETLWMLNQAARSELIGAVVGWVDLTAPDVDERLASLQESKHGRWLAGIRHQVHDEADPHWLRRQDVQRGLAAVGDADLAYDLLIRPNHLESAFETARAHSNVSFCVNHIAKPFISAGQIEQWRADITRLASLPNVTCKLSGMVTEADWSNWTVEDLRPYVEVIMEAFGARRVMFGSDWPVCLLAASYLEILDATHTLLRACTDPERSAVFGGTACRIYKMEELV